MGFGLMGQYMAEKEHEYREKVVYPAAARRELAQRELRLVHARAERAPRRRVIIAWLGDRLIRAGQRLGGVAGLPAEHGPFGASSVTTATRT